MQNSSPYLQQQPYQQYNQNFFQGNYQQAPNYYQNTQVSNIDWQFIDNCNPEVIEVSNDYRSIQQILNIAINGDFGSDYQTNQNPSVLKLLNLIKVVLRYQVKCISELDQDQKKTLEQNKKMESSLKQNKKSASQYKKKLVEYVNIIRKSKTRERCPRCHITLANLGQLDEHMKVKHHELLKAWIVVRHNVDIPDFRKELNEIKKDIEECKAKQRNTHYFNDSNKPPKKRTDISPFNRSQNPNVFELPSEDEQPSMNRQQFQPQQQPQPQPQPQPLVQQTQPTYQKPDKVDDTYDLSKLNAKKHAEDFLTHRRRTTPILPQQVDEIVHKIANSIHEQSKQINYGEAAKEEGPEELRKDISEDVESEHPMPKTSSINNLKDLKNPQKTSKRRRKKKEEEEEKPAEEPKEEKSDDFDHRYGDSIPLTSSSLRSSFVFSSEKAEYDVSSESNAAPKSKSHSKDDNASIHSQSGSGSKQSKSKKQEDQAFASDNSYPNFEMPSNDYDFAVYESAPSYYNTANEGNSANAGNEAGEEEYEYEEEENADNYKPDAQQHEEFEYEYEYEDVTEDQGHIHPSPQPKSYKHGRNNDYDSLDES